MLSWLIEHLVVFVLNNIVKQIVLIPFRLGIQARVGFEYIKAGANRGFLRIALCLPLLGLLGYLPVFFRPGIPTWLFSGSVWLLGILGMFNVTVGGDMLREQMMRPWLKKMKKWYAEDVLNQECSWNDYLSFAAGAYGQMAIAAWSAGKQESKIAGLNSFVNKETGTFHLLKYMSFIKESFSEEAWNSWDQVCRLFIRSVINQQVENKAQAATA